MINSDKLTTVNPGEVGEVEETGNSSGNSSEVVTSSPEDKEDKPVESSDATQEDKASPWLKPYHFRPGQSGNPNGRPKRKWLTEIYEELLEEVAEDPEQRKALKQSLLAKLHSKGVVSSMILQQVQERTEGKISQPVDLNGQIDIVQIIEEGRKRLDK